MIIQKLREGGMEVWFEAQELSRLALLLDRAAYHVREGTGYNESTADAEDLECLAALFTASAVACEGHQGYKT